MKISPLKFQRQVALMGDNVIKKIHEKSILNGINGKKAPLSWLKKTLTFKDYNTYASW